MRDLQGRLGLAPKKYSSSTSRLQPSSKRPRDRRGTLLSDASSRRLTATTSEPMRNPHRASPVRVDHHRGVVVACFLLSILLLRRTEPQPRERATVSSSRYGASAEREREDEKHESSLDEGFTHEQSRELGGKTTTTTGPSRLLLSSREVGTKKSGCSRKGAIPCLFLSLGGLSGENSRLI